MPDCKNYVREIQSVNVISMLPRRMLPITFWDDDFQAIDPQHDDPMVITMIIENFVFMKNLIDQGSSVNILKNIQKVKDLKKGEIFVLYIENFLYQIYRPLY